MFEIKILENPITIAELKKMASEGFGDMVKAVVDVEYGTMAVGSELHVDAEIALMEREGARRNNIWGINLYPDKTGENFIEFDSMVNLKPSLGNRTRNVEDKKAQERIKEIVDKLIIQ
jgi:hypothetical protein